MIFTENCSAETERLKAALAEAEAVVIGAGAGISTAAGFEYREERFSKYFAILACSCSSFETNISILLKTGYFKFQLSDVIPCELT